MTRMSQQTAQEPVADVTRSRDGAPVVRRPGHHAVVDDIWLNEVCNLDEPKPVKAAHPEWNMGLDEVQQTVAP